MRIVLSSTAPPAHSSSVSTLRSRARSPRADSPAGRWRPDEADVRRAGRDHLHEPARPARPVPLVAHAALAARRGHASSRAGGRRAASPAALARCGPPRSGRSPPGAARRRARGARARRRGTRAGPRRRTGCCTRRGARPRRARARGVSPRGRRTASPAARNGGRGTSAPSPGAPPAARRRPGPPRGPARAAALRDVARLVVQRLGVHPRKIERVGRPCGHRLVADEHDVQVAGAGASRIERLAGLVALPLHRGAAEHQSRAGGDARLERGHEPGEPVEVAAERAVDGAREQRRLLRARRTKRGNCRLEGWGVIERRPDVLELDVRVLAARPRRGDGGARAGPGRGGCRRRRRPRGRRAPRRSPESLSSIRARHRGDRLVDRRCVHDRRVVVVLADRLGQHVEPAGTDRGLAACVQRSRLRRGRHARRRCARPRHARRRRAWSGVGRRARRSGDHEDEAHARMLACGH